ncbi:ACT domain-containing protein [Arthrobacter sp. NPDC097144]|uniref:ACT domain-containing protein n=1 Tax=Arthrobacter sp. NPDC097144 TaxID=3363946 RepID=UPI00382B6D98
MKNLSLRQLPDRYVMVQLDARDPLPSWSTGAVSFSSITRTQSELSLIVPRHVVPADTGFDGEWDCLGIDQQFSLDIPGIAASVASPLAAAGLSVFVVATVDTDYFLVRDAAAAGAALRAAGHNVTLLADGLIQSAR